jgi:hypothetical protein
MGRTNKIMPKNTKELNEIYGQAEEQSDFMDKRYPSLPGLRKTGQSYNKIGIGPTADGINPPGTTVSLPKPRPRFALPDVNMSEPVRSGLMKAGLNILAGSGPSTVPQSTASIVARGALAGVDEYQKQIALNAERDRLNRLFGFEKSKFGLQKDRLQHQIGKEIASVTREVSKLGSNQIIKNVDRVDYVGRASSYPGGGFETDRKATQGDYKQTKKAAAKATAVPKTRADFGNNAAIAARKFLIAKGETDDGALGAAEEAAFNAAVLPGLGFKRKTVVTREADAGGLFGMGSRAEETSTQWVKTIDGVDYGPPANLNEVLQGLPFEGGTYPVFTVPKTKPTETPPAKETDAPAPTPAKKPTTPPPKKGRLAAERDDDDDARVEELMKKRREIKKGRGGGASF